MFRLLACSVCSALKWSCGAVPIEIGSAMAEVVQNRTHIEIHRKMSSVNIDKTCIGLGYCTTISIAISITAEATAKTNAAISSSPLSSLLRNWERQNPGLSISILCRRNNS